MLVEIGCRIACDDPHSVSRNNDAHRGVVMGYGSVKWRQGKGLNGNNGRHTQGLTHNCIRMFSYFVPSILSSGSNAESAHIAAEVTIFAVGVNC